MDKKTAKSLAVHYHAFLSTDADEDPNGKWVAAMGLREDQEKTGIKLMTPRILDFFIRYSDDLMKKQRATK